MALCEHCQAQLDGKAERLPGPWFDHDDQKVAGRLQPKQWQTLEILWRRHGQVEFELARVEIARDLEREAGWLFPFELERLENRQLERHKVGQIRWKWAEREQPTVGSADRAGRGSSALSDQPRPQNAIHPAGDRARLR